MFTKGARMEKIELLEYVREMFNDCGQMTIEDIVIAMDEGADTKVTEAEALAVCEILIAEDMIEKNAYGYGTTEAFEEEKEANFAEMFAWAVTEHAIKKAAA